MNQKNSKQRRRVALTLTLIIGGVAALSAVGSAFAVQEGLGTVAQNIINTLTNVARLITGVGFVAGFAFAIAAIFKFKQHKDNPTQIPVGTPIALLFIGAALMFLPSLFATVGTTVFGTSYTAGSPTGQSFITGSRP